MNQQDRKSAARRAALYLRVSTEEQSVENQRPELERLAAARGLDVVAVYAEQASAAKKRPEYERMMDEARRGGFAVLLIWSLDRLGRSMMGNIEAVLELDRVGVQVVSVREPWLDTTGPVRKLLLAVFAWMTEQERLQIVERTKAGLERARRKGVQVGRPPKAIDLAEARALRASGLSLREIAAALRVSPATVYRALRADELRRQGRKKVA